ncbi:MAG: flagellar hook-basal body complex protein [Eubacteriales bacterium]|nr:flagellar hook-basal body complex protein [Eubacteriales bacterium]
MLGSMYSAVSGLSAHQTKMNVIGNNIANVNTYGFKASRVTFSDVFYQMMGAASTPSADSGGTNPTQLGYGAKVNSIDVLNTRAGNATTDRALDVYINGDGYLPVKNSNGAIKYTRVGVLSFDVAGNLVDSSGNQVLGFNMDPATKNALLNSDGTTSSQNLVAIKVKPEDIEKYTGIAIGNNGEITAIKEGDPTFVPSPSTSWMDGAPAVAATSLYKGPMRMTVSRGFTPSALYTGPQAAVFISSNAAIDVSPSTMSVAYDNTNTPPYTLTYMNGGTPRTATGTLDTATNTVTFTGVDDQEGGANGTVTIPIHGTDTAQGYNFVDGDPAVSIGTLDSPGTYDITATTSDKSGATVTLNATWNGTDTTVTLGDVKITLDTVKFQETLDEGCTDVNIGTVGPGDGVPEKIAHIAVVKFTNPDGLSQDGEGYYIETSNSGKAVATIPGSGGTGTFRAGALEMSNVDLSREFTEMIIAQRGFQANTRMITVSDEMLSELVNMKR